MSRWKRCRVGATVAVTIVLSQWPNRLLVLSTQLSIFSTLASFHWFWLIPLHIFISLGFTELYGFYCVYCPIHDSSFLIARSLDVTSSSHSLSYWFFMATTRSTFFRKTLTLFLRKLGLLLGVFLTPCFIWFLYTHFFNLLHTFYSYYSGFHWLISFLHFVEVNLCFQNCVVGIISLNSPVSQ